jgi:hypothetical protein
MLSIDHSAGGVSAESILMYHVDARNSGVSAVFKFLQYLHCQSKVRLFSVQS